MQKYMIFSSKTLEWLHILQFCISFHISQEKHPNGL
jgi:hypothetical protein